MLKVSLHPPLQKPPSFIALSAYSSTPSRFPELLTQVLQVRNTMGCHPQPDQAPIKATRKPDNTYSRTLSEQEQFLVFVKILFLFIKKDGDENLLLQARAIVKTCIQRNRNDDPDYASLRESVQSQLRRTVGDPYWVRAKHSFIYHCRRNRIRMARPLG